MDGAFAPNERENHCIRSFAVCSKIVVVTLRVKGEIVYVH